MPSWYLISAAPSHVYSTSRIDCAFLAFDFYSAPKHVYAASTIDCTFLAFDIWRTEPCIFNVNDRLCFHGICFLLHCSMYIHYQRNNVIFISVTCSWFCWITCTFVTLQYIIITCFLFFIFNANKQAILARRKEEKIGILHQEIMVKGCRIIFIGVAQANRSDFTTKV